MGLRTLRSRIIAGFLLAILPASALLGGYFLNWLERSSIQSLSQMLQAESRMISHLAEREMLNAAAPHLSTLTEEAARDLGRRLTIVDPHGVVLAESYRNAREMEDHASRPEIRAALRNGSGVAIRFSTTTREEMLYVAQRIGPEDRPLGVARLAEPLSESRQSQALISRTFGAAALVAIAVATCIALWLAAGILGPIRQVSEAVQLMGKGELSTRVTFLERPADELFRLAQTLNKMASTLSETMEDLGEEKAKLEAIFSKTVDAIIVVDSEERIQMLNPVASRMLVSPAAEASGKTVIEATLSHDLAELVRRVLDSGEPASLPVSLARAGREVNAYVVPLETASVVCAVIIMHDLTEARKIDSMRRDFIANVSHELRTPLASIKAMSETILLRGKTDEKMVSEYAASISAETDRLVHVTEDLLDLSSIEAGRRSIRREPVPVTEIVSAAVESLASAAAAKQIGIETSEVDDTAAVPADREALYQAVRNLMDNAIKYTPDGGSVTVSASCADAAVCIRVADNGIGIAAEHLPRIFERFYRVDKARSRASGGTGLGLSIVKHVVEAHDGQVTVESQPGRGTVFTVCLPCGE